MFKIAILCFLTFLKVKPSEEYIPNDSIKSSEKLNFEIDLKNVQKLPRFWTNTGFCPPAPTNDSSTLAEFFLSEKSVLNMEYISSLPNNGLTSVRIHWLINLIQFVGFDEYHGFRYDFSNMDQVLDQLMEMRVYPVIEFMGNPSNRFFNQKHYSQSTLWKDLVYQMLSRYIRPYLAHLPQVLK